MTAQTLLTSLLHAKASITDELLHALAILERDAPPAALPAALRVLHHAHRVDLIFAAHLDRRPHAFTASWSDAAVPLQTLSADMRDTARWYVERTAHLTPEDLEERIPFTFTDGAKGLMSRAEMLAHVITHSAYHRGEVGRLLPEIEAVAMRDVFAGYLHRADPARRRRAA
jgi:uncharacterized damage-inducible protein DinB